MKNYQIALGGLLVVLFDWLFWQEKLGLNLLVFNTLLLVATVLNYKHSLNRLRTIAVLFCTLLTATMVVWHGSFVAKLACLVSLALAVVLTHQPHLKAIHYTLAYVLVAVENTLTGALDGLFAMPKQWQASHPRLRIVWRYTKIATVPIGVFLVFFLIFKVANPIFSQLIDIGFEKMLRWTSRLWTHIEPLHILFVLVGAFGIFTCLYNWKMAGFWGLNEDKEEEVIIRKRSLEPALSIAYPIKMLALRNEYRIGIMLMAMVNVLLCILNMIDVQYIWLGDVTYLRDSNLASQLHEGTYMLIFSIVLSISIMLYLFRRNLNFYPNHDWLKYLAYVWIIQNAILVLSVAIRAYYYVIFRGLAYKRIGVLIFLGLTLVGLFTLWIKIQDKRTSYFLLKTNGWAVYLMLVFMACIDWDMEIVRYNIAHYAQQPAKYKEVDMEFMLSRADKTLRILQKNKAKLPLTDQDNETLANRIKYFCKTQEKYTFWSWTYEESETLLYLKSIKITSKH